MSVELMTLVWKLPARITCAEKMVLLKLADHADDDGGHVYPSKERVAERCSLDIRTVRKVMAKFEHDGLLVKVAERLGMPTVYRIDVKMLRGCSKNRPPTKMRGVQK